MRVDEHWHRLFRDVVGSSSLETVKTQLEMILGSLLWLNMLKQGGWTRHPPEVPSRLSNFVILQSSVSLSNVWLLSLSTTETFGTLISHLPG